MKKALLFTGILAVAAILFATNTPEQNTWELEHAILEGRAIILYYVKGDSGMTIYAKNSQLDTVKYVTTKH